MAPVIPTQPAGGNRCGQVWCHNPRYPCAPSRSSVTYWSVFIVFVVIFLRFMETRFALRSNEGERVKLLFHLASHVLCVHVSRVRRLGSDWMRQLNQFCWSHFLNQSHFPAASLWLGIDGVIEWLETTNPIYFSPPVRRRSVQTPCILFPCCFF